MYKTKFIPLNFAISPFILEKTPNLRLGYIAANVTIETSSLSLSSEIHAKSLFAVGDNTTISIKDSKKPISEARLAYRSLGKEPSRYRLSAEALSRRVINGKGLYQINNVVDCLNLTSIYHGFSIGGYDFDKINGDIELKIGEKQMEYQAIGRGSFNIENLPVLFDKLGPFGNPSSDSVRTAIQDDTTSILLVFFDFGNNTLLKESMDFFIDLLKKHIISSQISFKIQ